jgi:nucleoid-associated protein YgaU
MTKEAKVGMLTGLGVIVVIGVLLSEYLGTPPGGAPSSVATGKMAPLPIGETKRTQMLEEVGVPAMVQAESTAVAGGVPTIPAAFAADVHRDVPLAVPVSTGPVVSAPVSAVPAGPVQVASAQHFDVPPTVQVPETPTVSAVDAIESASATGGAAAGQAKASPAKMPGEEYVIARGDSLAKISSKFYQANTSANRQRIIAANPDILKDGQPFLIAGRKIVIPAAPTAVLAPAMVQNVTQPIAKADPRKAGEHKTQEPAVVIGLPGTKTTQNKIAEGKTAESKSAAPASKADAVKKNDARKSEAKVYVVKAGDSLEKIARKLDSENPQATLKKLIADNGLKNASVLQVGDKLKLPM